jgi:glycosyltransferase involved in cell wall biosynthesis
MMEPKVSIIIPVYNGADYLREAIQSAIAQTYKNLEIIVINDGSDDGGKTDLIARAYGDRIVYYCKSNGGVASALNLGIQKMTGEYFSWLSHDDIYYENKIEVQMNYLKKCRETVITYCDFEKIDGKSQKCGVKRIKAVPSEQFRNAITRCTSVHGCTFLIPKVCFEECGLFDEKLITTQDYDMWFRLAKKYKINHTADVLVKARYHCGQGSQRLKDIAIEEIDDLMIKYLHDLSAEEITKASKAPLGLSYAYIARNFVFRGLPRAKSLALRLALAEERMHEMSPLERGALYNVIYVQMPITRLLNHMRRYLLHIRNAMK